MRLGLLPHPVGATLDPAALRRLAAAGYPRDRAAQVLGVNWSTLDRVARVYRIEFPVHWRGYGWRGIRDAR